MINTQQHWDNIYNTRPEEEFSWFQPYPKTSMELVESLSLPFSANIIDIGGGDSRFVDSLLDKGYQNIWVLDISATAIERAQQRLGERGKKVHWIITEVTAFEPKIQFDLWHDRAAFHFLRTEDEQNKYVSVAEAAIKTPGYLVIGTFSEAGPKKCSGLEICRYSEATLSARFDKSFDRINCVDEGHTTPSGNLQQFLFCAFRKSHQR